jgi:hypothetical protein
LGFARSYVNLTRWRRTHPDRATAVPAGNDVSGSLVGVQARRPTAA